jgi:hypothetical protein
MLMLPVVPGRVAGGVVANSTVTGGYHGSAQSREPPEINKMRRPCADVAKLAVLARAAALRDFTGDAQ